MDKGNLKWLLLVFAALAGIFWYQQHQISTEREAKKEAELQAGLRASEIISAKFEETGSLLAGRLRGEVLSQGACTSAYVFSNAQETIAPFSVAYMVDLSRVDRSRLRWNGDARTLFVELPALTVEEPAVDMRRARSKQSGKFISRDCGLAMQRQVAERLSSKAGERSQRADYLARAQQSARIRVANLLRATLTAADVRTTEVRVRLASDATPVNDERWDMSRSIEEVLAEAKSDQ